MATVQTSLYVPGAKDRSPALDGLRGLAILLVMLFHQCIINPTNPVDSFFFHLFRLGWCGVDLFFVLSGFLITGILLDTKGHKHYLRNFYARRTLRIMPLYYAVVFFSLVILSQFDHPKHEKWAQIEGQEFAYWLFLSNFAIAVRGAWCHGILDISWSLSIEEQFYLLWPLCVLFMSKQRFRNTCVGLFCGALLFRILMLFDGSNPITIYVLTFSRVDALAVGAWIAIAAREEGGLERLIPKARFMATASSMILIALWIVHDDYNSYVSPEFQSLGYTVLTLCLAPFWC